MGLFADQDLRLGAFRANSARLVHGGPDQGELRLGLADNAGDHVSCMDADLDAERRSILQRHSACIMVDSAGEVDDSDGMVTSKQTRVNVPLTDSEATARHVRLSDSLNLLDAILLTELIKSIVGFVQQLHQVAPTVRLHDLIEALDINEDDSDFALCLREVFLAVLDAGSDQTGNEDADNGPELLKLLDLAVLRDKLDLALDLVPVSVVDPLEEIDHYCNRLPHLVVLRNAFVHHSSLRNID